MRFNIDLFCCVDILSPPPLVIEFMAPGCFTPKEEGKIVAEYL